MDIESKIWTYAGTGTKVHAFIDGVALCRKNLRNDPKVTPEVIVALAVLREGDWSAVALMDAFNTLDNAGIFSAIDEAMGYDVGPEPERISKCTCVGVVWEREGHRANCPGDPAEWGDMAYTTAMAAPVRPGATSCSPRRNTTTRRTEHE